MGGRDISKYANLMDISYHLQSHQRNEKQEPKKLIIAIPVVPRETLELLKKEADHVEAVIIPITTNFRSVGQFYEDFSPVSDEDVMKIMKDQK